MKNWNLIVFTRVSIAAICVSANCVFPPISEGGDFKVISLFPRKVIKYFCNPGFHFWGQEVIECDPDQGWLGSLGTCLVDSSLNKIAYSSSSGVDANVPIRQNNFEGNYHFQHY